MSVCVCVQSYKKPAVSSFPNLISAGEPFLGTLVMCHEGHVCVSV